MPTAHDGLQSYLLEFIGMRPDCHHQAHWNLKTQFSAQCTNDLRCSGPRFLTFWLCLPCLGPIPANLYLLVFLGESWFFFRLWAINLYVQTFSVPVRFLFPNDVTQPLQSCSSGYHIHFINANYRPEKNDAGKILLLRFLLDLKFDNWQRKNSRCSN